MAHHSIKSQTILAALMTLIALHASAGDGAEQPDRPASSAAAATAGPNQAAIGRPVRIVSFSFRLAPFDEVLSRIDREASLGADLIALPETWRGQTDDTMEPLDGPTIRALSVLAKKHHTYILSPIDAVVDGTMRRNVAVLIDRQGQVVGAYHKVYPYWGEFDHKQPVEPGETVPVFETDFGKLGVAICFDVNFPEVWQKLADGGAEIVVWPSAYSAGEQLKAYALLHHFYIVTATWTGDCQVYDITGRRLIDNQTPGINVTRVTLDLDRGIYHDNFNIQKRDKLLQERSSDVAQEDFLTREAWFVLKAITPGISARQLAKEYGLEELRDYVGRSRRSINELRTKQLTSKQASQP